MTLDLPPLTFTDELDRGAVVAATRLLIELVAASEVRQRWDEASACAGMTVGALAAHLVIQPRRAVEVLSAGPTDLAPISIDQHYARAAWLLQDLDGPANVGVRDRSQDEASSGQQSAVEAARAALTQLTDVVAAAPPVVLVPWQGTALSTDDFLVTRLMEIVVHSDDLAASVGLPTPEFTPSALEPVVTLLTHLALRRHGQDALVRSLSRPQRAPQSISAF